jgi:hypothetical protein
MMNKQLLTAVLLAGLAAAMPAAGAAELACGANAPLSNSVRLEYAVTATRSVLSLAGDGVFEYRRRGDSYVIDSSVTAIGIFESLQSSAGNVRAQGLVPRTFTLRSSRRPERSIDFDWAARQVSFSHTGNVEPTRPQMQDRLSMMMQLAWRHRSEPQVSTFELPVAGPRHVATYVFKSQGAEAVTVPAGRFEAVKFERYKESSDDEFEVWLAPALCSLPVRLRFSDDKGLVIEQRLSAVRAL